MLDESPDSLIHSAIEGFETQPDLLSLERVTRMQAQLGEVRAQKVQRLEKDVAALENTLSQRQEELRALSVPSSSIFETLGGENPADFDDVFKVLSSKSAVLDTEKVLLAKQLTEVESAINQMSMVKIQMSRQRDEYEQTKEQALAANVAKNLNTTAMKIALFHKLGVHIDAKDGRDQVMIFDRSADAASLLEIDPKYSDYFISNYIWDRLGNET